MKVLGIDTSTPLVSAAIVDGDDVLHSQSYFVEDRRAGLLPLVDEVCRAAGVQPSDLDAVAVGAGPGSFTGLRIGMATAKGIAFALGRPLWAVSSLAAIALDDVRRGESSAPPPPADVIIALIDARRGEVYAGAYRRVEHGAHDVVPNVAQGVALIGNERVMPPSELVAFAASVSGPGNRTRFVGDQPLPYAELEDCTYDAQWGRRPTASCVAWLALAGSRADILVGGAPSYIRPSEAEVKYPDGVPGALRKR